MRSLFALLPFTLILAQAGLRFQRVPDSGIQPLLLADSQHRVHLLYFKGEAMGGDLYYATQGDGDKSFSPALKVNTQPASVIVAGTMRGPQMALGRDGRPHIVWMGGTGAAKAEVAGQTVTPLLYTRLSEGKNSFEPERNILTHVAGLDGGQSVGADQKGNVYVVWHGAPPGTEGEEARGLYVARSSDDGKNFAREAQASVPKKGACACCGVRARVDDHGALHVLFRSAEAGVNRSELWLKSEDFGKSFQILQEDPWKTAACPASSASFYFGSNRSVAAWETDNHVTGALRAGAKSVTLEPGGKAKQKHPVVAANGRGEVLLTWVEDAGWGTPGTLVCQIFDEAGKAKGERITKSKLPAWSFAAPYVDRDGNFVVLY